MDTQDLIEKYHDIITEEVNVKTITSMDSTKQVTIQYVPIGKELSREFGKDTGRIIGAAKGGNCELESDGSLIVHQGSHSWTLQPHQFEVRYSGFDGDHQTVEQGVMLEMDLSITDDLYKEGVARDISRFLNQMRKDADYVVSDRVAVYFSTESALLKEVLDIHGTYLQTEALLTSIEQGTGEGDVRSVFAIDDHSCTFVLKR